ncbi:MAG: TIGR01777 family protein [Elusimicrobia bacterium]|nr:TIGR01777 family protein [Elusimicrobiota bacterium]
MRVVVAGGTGFIGTVLCRKLQSLGHEPIALSRSARPSCPWPVLSWNPADPSACQAALDGAQAVINLCGESIAEGRWTAQRKRVLAESRLVPTRTLVQALAQARTRPAVLINASAVGYYGDCGDQELSEDSPPGGGFLAELCRLWEEEALQAKILGVRAVTLRLGVVLGPGGGALAKMLPIFKLGLGGPLGSGRQWMSWISLDDAAGLAAHLLDTEVSGPVNAVSPEPVENKDFARALGRALGRPAVLPAPAFALRLGLGEMSSVLLSSQKVLPVQAVKARYSFKHPNLDSVLRLFLTPRA